jgi:hypothetical protein
MNKRTLVPRLKRLAGSKGNKVKITNNTSRTGCLGSWVDVESYNKIEKPILIHSIT